jgi:CHAD domain-containing protein
MELDYVKLKDIKPVLTGYISEAQTLLKKFPVPEEKSVHDIRVLMKKSRALLKLAAPQIDKIYYDRDKGSLQKVGRILSSWRETSVQRKILKEFRKKNPEIFSQLADNSLLAQMIEKQAPLTVPTEEMITTLEQIRVLLFKTGYRIRFQSMKGFDPQLLMKDLELSYKKVSDIYIYCRNNPKTEDLHIFRKTAKDFLYQLYVFRPLNPPVVKTLEKKLDNMTQNLGKFNDLAQTMSLLGYKYKKGLNPPALDELILKLRDAQDGYLSKVWPSAYQVFCPGQKLVNVLGFKLLVI